MWRWWGASSPRSSASSGLCIRAPLWLVNDWAKIPIGVICLVLSAIITLPIPLGHVVPGTAICLLALGLMQRDGVVIGMGFAVAVLSLVIVILASAGVVKAGYHWFMG